MDEAIFEDYDNYIVYKNGRIYKKKSCKFIKPYLDRTTGYFKIKLFNLKIHKEKTFYLHRILATCFLPNPNNLKIIVHIDSIKNNNDLSNLKWVSDKERIIAKPRLTPQTPPRQQTESEIIEEELYEMFLLTKL